MDHEIKIALLDMNNNHPNQGMGNIREITESFKHQKGDHVTIEIFDVRYKNEIPNIEEFDIFISSGGPGNPHQDDAEWEPMYANFLNQIWDYNQNNEQKKYLFLICHSFQLAVIHWNLANVCQRNSYSFGVMPIHKAREGKRNFLLENLPDPFYAVDSRAYQCIDPNLNQLKSLKMTIIAIEKMRPHIHLQRAIMAIRFSPEIFGTQFHPEANPESMIENLKDDHNKNAMIENFGMEKYLETIDRIEDVDKIILTQQQILPRFLQQAYENTAKQLERSFS